MNKIDVAQILKDATEVAEAIDLVLCEYLHDNMSRARLAGILQGVLAGLRGPLFTAVSEIAKSEDRELSIARAETIVGKLQRCLESELRELYMKTRGGGQ